MEAPLPIHLLTPQNPDLLQHIYGAVNGVFLMSTVLMLITGISYSRKSSKLKVTNYLSISAAYMVVTVSFAAFSLYSIYYQGFSGAVSKSVIPQWLFDISRFGAPVGLACVTYILLTITRIKSSRAYRFQQNAWWFIYGLYILDFTSFIALFFIDNDEYITLLTGALFLPHTIGAIRYCLVGLKYEPYSKAMTALFCIMFVIFFEYSRRLYLRELDFSPEFIAATQSVFAINQIFFSFISLRYAYDEIHRILIAQQHELFHLLHGFGKALKDDEFFIAYQPQVDLKTNTVNGVEALIRWQHPTQGFIPPDQFIALAEDTDKINDICQWVITNTFKEIGALRQQSGKDLQVAINFSAKNLNAFMLGHLKKSLNEYQIPPKSVTVEITETVMLDNSEEVQKFFNEIHALGVKLSLDDYGTGFSSLSYLTQMNTSELKIDRSFIMDIVENHNHFVIASSTVAMGKSLNNKIVAEGVETEEILGILNEIGCDYAQGYYIAKPMPVAELQQWLHDSPYS